MSIFERLVKGFIIIFISLQGVFGQGPLQTENVDVVFALGHQGRFHLH